MTSQPQLQAVQQQIEDVLGKVSEMEKLLAAAKHAGDSDEVTFLRKRLEQLDRERNNLREKENILLRAQPGGQPYSRCHHWLTYLHLAVWTQLRHATAA